MSDIFGWFNQEPEDTEVESDNEDEPEELTREYLDNFRDKVEPVTEEQFKSMSDEEWLEFINSDKKEE